MRLIRMDANRLLLAAMLTIVSSGALSATERWSGVYLGGLLYEKTGSYNVIWWGGVVFGFLSALINLPIVEKSVPRPAVVPA